MDIKNILVPTDFSNSSKTAVSFAIELALRIEARLYLMHSIKSAFSLASERLLEELMSDDRFQKVEAQTITVIGDPGSSILRQSEEIDADLILMGNKGSSGGRKFLGSVTTEVIAKSPIPVLAVPEKSEYSTFKEIVFMTDFNDGDLSALDEIIQWAKHFNADLHVLHLFTDDSLQELIKFRGFRELAKEHLDYGKLSFERVFNPSFDEGFLDYLETRAPKLVVVTRYKKPFVQKLTEKDHTRQIGYDAMIPFLTLPGEKYIPEKHADVG